MSFQLSDIELSARLGIIFKNIVSQAAQLLIEKLAALNNHSFPNVDKGLPSDYTQLVLWFVPKQEAKYSSFGLLLPDISARCHSGWKVKDFANFSMKHSNFLILFF